MTANVSLKYNYVTIQLKVTINMSNILMDQYKVVVSIFMSMLVDLENEVSKVLPHHTVKNDEKRILRLTF